ncbi:uncharacterized protein PHACADRAFT_156227 [Phanerochaete carnosa HHB-10118-sp]|uniref:FAD-binding PCMH-type domain-containing protein n=1 Tax=Phanerochaete carnosa (strain HHB-10118-sp) TaxID=650164 RepID=K5WPA3_PHACS|nr:uncharacterized protein PHACADRAFT_156227 [Phanerochaete carnosa HHB-10118-sp]EKM61059.1 hypothetical protein PHACADRAFT_156227 [Phanerochaete carnosa HHB-10118-sp]
MLLHNVNILCTWLGLSCGFITRFFDPSPGTSGFRPCRCLPTDKCWPSDAVFAALESQLSEKLLAPLPPAKACYSSLESEACKEAQRLWLDGWWRANQSGATQNSNFATYVSPDGDIEACYLNTTLGHPCRWGSTPIIGVDTRSVEDIQFAVNFAAAHNLRVIIKNTGHDYLGRSTARGAFLIWTHHLKNTTFHYRFRPTGAPEYVAYYNVITLGSGVQWQEAYNAAFVHGRSIVGGITPGGTVGAAGGWLQGGGHGILAPLSGLGVDNAVEISIVTSGGKYLVVNAYHHSDLFWALRGGGGGTWGVVVSVTYQTYPSVPILSGLFSASIIASPSNASATPSPTLGKLFTELVRVTTAWADSGWSGYTEMFSIGPGHHTIRLVHIAPATAGWAAVPVMERFYSFARQLAANSSVEDGGALHVDLAAITPFPSFGVWERMLFHGETEMLGANVEIGSRLLPRNLLVNNQTEVADTVLGLDHAFVGFFIVAGGAVSKIDPSTTGLNPAWREALIHVVFGSGWPEGASVDAINEVRAKIKKGEAAFRTLTPQGGAYFNEASLYEADSKYEFFGSHYDKLRAIKRIYDPIDLFVVPGGVGSEEWDADLYCRI